ncbi:hypothetical protein AHFPHNDE_03858 [Pseudomonas sp. MM227]|uniref:hypothetical protein n=1 Tax=Pseudomonas sp. MM227 TaxID=3019968 RepID=UPI00221E5AA7|nr:hypothetical protein [Pseudomonas sp. MM227]CAI3790139.1 hypothetical protein AHFPHNDE_03858 [Pseudomonas sp. MM227]
MLLDWAGATVGEARAPIPANVIAASLGKTVEVTNVILVDGVSGVASPTLTLRVQDLPAAALKPPKVVQASDGTLDLNTFSTAATVSVDPWPLIATGQTYWLRAYGTLDDGTTRSEELAMGVAVTAAQVSSGLLINLPRSFLLRLKNALPLTLELKVSLSKSVSENEAITFPEEVLSITQLTLVLPAPTVENETDGYLDPAAIPNTGVKIMTPVYEGIEAGQWVGLEWTAVDDAGSVTLPAREVMAQDSLEFVVPKATALLSAGKAVSVAYTVRRVSGGLVQTSTPRAFELSVDDPGAGPVLEGFEEFSLGPIALPVTLASECILSIDQSVPGIDFDAKIGNESGESPFVTGNYLELHTRPIAVFFLTFIEPVNQFQLGVYFKDLAAKGGFLKVREVHGVVTEYDLKVGYAWEAFQSESGQNTISAIELDMMSGTSIRLDNLSFQRV